MKAPKNIVDDINNNRVNIINSLKQESIVVYQFLQSELNKKDIAVTNNHLFQFVFRHFYGMNRVGLTDDFYLKYFGFLEEFRNKPQEFKLDKMVEDFYALNTIKRKKKEKKSLQFSFLTKLYHSVNPTKPIYDKYVCLASGISQYYISNKKNKITKLLKAYEYLEKLYEQIDKDNSLSAILEMFDKKFEGHEINKTMQYDFIFWKAGILQEEK